MIKVGIDTSPLRNQNATRGIGKYTRLLLENLKKEQGVEIIEKEKDNFSSVDLIHYPFFDFFFPTLPLNITKKVVVTIHDCIPLVFPKHYPSGVKGKLNLFRQKMALKKVSAIITDSENSKKDIINYLKIPEKKIHRVYLAADPVYTVPVISKEKEIIIRKKYNLGGKFILYVGDVNYNKNLPTLLASFSQVIKNYPGDLKLVLVGKAFEDNSLNEVKNLHKIISELGIEKSVIFLGFVPDEELIKLYNLALICCQPSLYEGFGLQILEAMSCGCSVISSDVSSIPEISGDAAYLIDPKNPSSLTEAISVLLNDNSLRAKMIRKGLEQSKLFTWKQTAEQTLETYKGIIKNV